MNNLDEGLIEVEQGVFVERDTLHIAEKIQEYDSNLRLQYLEQADRLDQPPFRILEKCKDGQERVAFTAWQLDDRILERIFAADTRKFDINNDLDVINQKAKADANRRYQEKAEEAQDLVSHIIASPKDTYTAKIDGEVKKFRA